MDTMIFDNLINEKTKGLLEIYERKTKNKKMILNADIIDYNSKKLYNQINAGFIKKLKNSKSYQKKCENELYEKM